MIKNDEKKCKVNKNTDYKIEVLPTK